MILIHGTTRDRAEHLLLHSPNLGFKEPGMQFAEENFSMYIEGGPYDYGTPEEYALAKAKLYPDENGPVLLRVDVPDEIVRLAANDWFPIQHGLVFNSIQVPGWKNYPSLGPIVPNGFKNYERRTSAFEPN